MKLDGENFSRNGHDVFKGTIKAIDEGGTPMGWADVVNLYDRRQKVALTNSIENDLLIPLDDARRMVNQLHEQLEMEARAAESLPDEDVRTRSGASALVGLAEHAELWHTSDGDAFATIETSGHRETWSVTMLAMKSQSILVVGDTGPQWVR